MEKWFCASNNLESTCVVPAFELGAVKSIYERITRIRSFFREQLENRTVEARDAKFESFIDEIQTETGTDNGEKSEIEPEMSKPVMCDHFSLLREIDGPVSVYYEEAFVSALAASLSSNSITPRVISNSNKSLKETPNASNNDLQKSLSAPNQSLAQKMKLGRSNQVNDASTPYVSPDDRFNRLKTNYRSMKETCINPQNPSEVKVLITQQSQFDVIRRLNKSIAMNETYPTGKAPKSNLLFLTNSKTATFRRACTEDAFWTPRNALERELHIIHGLWQDLNSQRARIMQNADFSQLEKLNLFIIEELLCMLSQPDEAKEMRESKLGLDEKLISFLVRFKPPAGSLHRLHLNSGYMVNAHLRSIFDNHPEIAMIHLRNCWGLGGDVGRCFDGNY